MILRPRNSILVGATSRYRKYLANLTFAVLLIAGHVEHEGEDTQGCQLFDNDAILIDDSIMVWPGFC